MDLHCGRTLIDFLEIAVAAEAVLEAGGAGDAIFRQCFTPVVPFLNQRIANGEAMAADGGTTIGTDADLRKARDLGVLLLFLDDLMTSRLGSQVSCNFRSSALLSGAAISGQADSMPVFKQCFCSSA